MDTPDRCPDCRSPEVAQVERFSSMHGTILTVVCRACDWSADPRIGRPPADRSKNVGLRRLLRDNEAESGGDEVRRAASEK